MGLYVSHHAATPLLRDLFGLFVRLYVRPKVTGIEHIPKSGPWILASNHASHADTAVLFSAIPDELKKRLLAAAAQDYFFVGGLRQSAARILFNAIPVERESPGRRDPLRHVSRALREGYAVLIYPEGTRSRTGKIGTFRPGIGRLIAQFPNTPVIPALLEGTDAVMPKGHSVPLPRSVRVSFGPPLYLEASLRQRSSWQEATNAVRAAVLALQEQPQEA